MGQLDEGFLVAPCLPDGVDVVDTLPTVFLLGLVAFLSVDHVVFAQTVVDQQQQLMIFGGVLLDF